MSTTFLTVPDVDLVPGLYGPYVTPPVGSVYAGWRLIVTPGANYPIAADPKNPGRVFNLWIDVSHDSGASWGLDAWANYSEGPWEARGGIPLTADVIERTLGRTLPGTIWEAPILMLPTDLYQIRLEVVQACNCSIVMESL